jgi:hypothetical protein
MNASSAFRAATLLACLCLTVLTTGCSTVLYQASGTYEDDESLDREILLQWKAQKYYIPFVNADVDYGSVSLQAECLPDVLLDHKNSEEHGFVFVERPNDYSLADGAPDHRIGNNRICAKFDGNLSIEQLSKDDETRLQILCEPRFPAPFLAPNLVGYMLTITEGQIMRTLECQD